jgi:hypothetical protein
MGCVVDRKSDGVHNEEMWGWEKGVEKEITRVPTLPRRTWLAAWPCARLAMASQPHSETLGDSSSLYKTCRGRGEEERGEE